MDAQQERARGPAASSVQVSAHPLGGREVGCSLQGEAGPAHRPRGPGFETWEALEASPAEEGPGSQDAQLGLWPPDAAQARRPAQLGLPKGRYKESAPFRQNLRLGAPPAHPCVLLRSQEATLGRGCGASPSRPTCLHCVWLVEVARRGGSSEPPESSLLPPAPVPANGWEDVVCVLEPHVPNCSLVSHDLELAPPGDPSVFASPSHPRRRRPRGNQPHFCPPAAAALPTGGPSGPSAVVMPWTGSVTRRWPVLPSLIAPATAGPREHETSCQLPKVSAPLEAVSRSDY